jgi:hypothetical protein
MSKHKACGFRADKLKMPSGVCAWWCVGCLRYLDIYELDRVTWLSEPAEALR